MSSRRSSRASKPTDDEITELVLKLQALLPLPNQSHNSTVAAAASTILEETCTYIKSLHREVDSLSERLSQLIDAADIELITRLLCNNKNP
ncbi:hypothetical protein FNV43_RR20513 [Rhamnella rubrinervis]|uniref:BHLH domain-containing protein n=1 Tax=Rhamnella rubrinervis TaxID=2594499 RepID=A0A8K0GQJ2_9ROSA|nr:hypothetical protein FNV43_RR20513 [Rhamnella rubrinervis]